MCVFYSRYKWISVYVDLFVCVSIFIILSFILMCECETKEQLEQSNNSIILMAATVKIITKTATTTNRIHNMHAINIGHWRNFMRDSFIVWYEHVNVLYLFRVSTGSYWISCMQQKRRSEIAAPLLIKEHKFVANNSQYHF